jgi:hypothetical protein
MLEERDNGVSLYGLCSSGGPEERSDGTKTVGIGKGTGYIFRLKGVAAALESVVVLERPEHLPQLRLR